MSDKEKRFQKRLEKRKKQEEKQKHNHTVNAAPVKLSKAEREKQRRLRD